MATAKAASAEGASVIVASSKKTNVDRALAELPAGAEAMSSTLHRNPR
ncbi:MAG: hypothetical protein JO251_03335 [Verrucomicrobia bacterium]|nr:hypothetical protein [Verrucomicrobiota bacterium]